jgi:hypothetical protein
MRGAKEWAADIRRNRENIVGGYEPQQSLSDIIREIQADAIEECIEDVADTATYWDEDDRPAFEDALRSLRNLLPKPPTTTETT